MTEPEREPAPEPSPTATPTPAAAHRRKVRARGAIFAGIALIVAATLQLADAGYGRNPHREFGERRAYNTVKTDVHEALPTTILLGGLGLALITLGAWFGRERDGAA